MCLILIMRNVQVAEICRRLPRTIAALKEIEGVGEATVTKYGEEILKQIPPDLKAETPDDSAEAEPQPEDAT